jgi:hypothetical protein
MQILDRDRERVANHLQSDHTLSETRTGRRKFWLGLPACRSRWRWPRARHQDSKKPTESHLRMSRYYRTGQVEWLMSHTTDRQKGFGYILTQTYTWAIEWLVSTPPSSILQTEICPSEVIRQSWQDSGKALMSTIAGGGTDPSWSWLGVDGRVRVANIRHSCWR